MNRQDILTIISPHTNFEEIEVVRKGALLEWIKSKKSSEQGFEDGEAEYGYKSALEDLYNYLNKVEE